MAGYVYAVERVVLVGFLVLVVLVVLVVALLDRTWARGRRAQLSKALERSETRTAFNELMAAQSLFTAEVLRYEAAIEAENVPAGTVRLDIYAPGKQLNPQPLERMKDEPRRRLLAAKQRWEQIRPRPVEDAGPPQWIGFGEIRTWGLFLVGGERAFLRFEHVSDPSIWVTVELARRRVGVGLGVEIQNVGAAADHADPSLLLAMSQASLDHREFACRPGFDVVRTLRRWRSTEPYEDLAELLRVRSHTSAMWQGSSRDDVADARRLIDQMASLDPELVDPIDADAVDLRTEADQQPGILRCSVAGPTVMLGWWQSWGTPALTVLGRSPHGEWSKPYDPTTQQRPEPESKTSGSSFDTPTNSQV